MNAHPDIIQIRSYLTGEASEQDSAGLVAHLEHCDGCAARVDDVRAEHDLWIERIRSAGVPATTQQQAPRIIELSGYKVCEEIGRGGQGIVYRAIQSSTKREVAIKVLLEGPYASASARRRFEREVEIVAGFRHAHIVTVFDSGTTPDGRSYCVMDFVQGRRLDEHVRDERLSATATLELFAVVCDAVNYAHQRGVIHRDLKPSNILVDGSGVPRILDFGLAKDTTATGDTVATSMGLAAGTLPYLSPEQAGGAHNVVDIRTDVYACGVILHELLTGTHPYPVSGDLATVLHHIMNTPPTRAQHSGPVSHMPGWRQQEADTILQKALAKEPERRYQSAGAMADDIRRHLAGEPIAARRHSSWYVITRTIRRHKLPVLTGALSMLLIAGAAVVLAFMVHRQSQLLSELEEQTDAAQVAEAIAEQRFEQVRELANSFVTEFEPAIRDLAGATEARELVVTKGLAYLNALASSADDADLKAELGQAYLGIADVQGHPKIANLGDQHGALENYTKAVELLQSVAAARPKDADAGYDLYVAYYRLANLRLAMGQRSEARIQLNEAKHLLDKLCTLHPPVDYRNDIASVNDWLAADLKHQGRLEQALKLTRESLRIRQSLAGDSATTRALAISHQNSGDLLFELGHVEEALVSHEKFLEIAAALAESAPDSFMATGDVGVAHDKVGFCHQTLGQPQQALTHYRASLAINLALTQRDPSDILARGRLTFTHCRIGDIELASGDIAAARDSFEAYHKQSSELAAITPDNPGAQRELGVAQYKMAELHMTLAADTAASVAIRIDHWRNAESWLQRCLEVFNGLRERSQLSDADAGVPTDIADEIVKCRATADGLDADNTQTAADD